MMHPGRVPCLCLTLLTLGLGGPAAALELAWPDDAEPVLRHSQTVVGFRIATGAFDGRANPSRMVDGTLIEEIWRLPGAEQDPATLALWVRDQLLEQGYEIGFSCADKICGGFDFRFAFLIAEGPDMYVDLGNFQYLTAQRAHDPATDGAETGAEDLAITLSQGGQAGYVHIAQIHSGAARPAPPALAITPGAAAQGRDLAAQLLADGHAVLEDLTFDSGASALSGDRYESLAALAAWLAQNSLRRVVLVGHTDASGSQETNEALSKARAETVRRALITGYGVVADQVTAAGVGYLAPRAANNTAIGRETNRRVEVVVLAE